MTACEQFGRMLASIGREAFVIEPVVDNCYASGWNAEEAVDVVRGLLAHGDEVILPVRETSYNGAAVEHSQQVIFSW